MRRRFAIGETGFGTGLNFLCAYRLWRRCAKAGARLTYFSIEKHPLSRGDLRRAHSLWPELQQEAAWLGESYPAATPGFHLRHLPHGVTLILGLGDIAEMLAELQGQCDAWFLDGFSPDRNPAMWQPDLWERLAACTAPGGTLASFTAAGEVRRGLAAAGFSVKRGEGFGNKRHMTLAGKPGASQNTPSPARTVVIGGGIAGASVARALAERGVEVDVLERATGPAAGGSGNPAAILFPLLPKEWTPPARFYVGAYQHVLRRLETWPDLREGLVGMIQLPKKQRGRRDGEGLSEVPAKLGLPPEIARPVDAAEASRLAGITLPLGGLFFEQGGWVDLRALTSNLLDHPSIRLRGSSLVERIERKDEAWQVFLRDDALDTESVILANASGINDFLPSSFPIHSLGGQLSCFLDNERTSVQEKVVCFGGYLLPATRTGQWLGATYEHDRSQADITQQSHGVNLAKLADALPEIAESLRPRLEAMKGRADEGWVGFRAVSPDRLPLIGEIDRGAYVSLAHGSRGSVSALLAGELIAAMLCGEIWPVERSAAARLSPQRFDRAGTSFRRRCAGVASRLDFDKGDDT